MAINLSELLRPKPYGMWVVAANPFISIFLPIYPAPQAVYTGWSLV